MSPDAIVPITKTMVFLGAAATVPTRDPNRPEWPENGLYRVLVALDQPGVLDVSAGSTGPCRRRAGGSMCTCPDVTISDVASVNR